MYPWDKWLKPGKRTVLVQGKDFMPSAQPHSMGQMLRTRAFRRGLSVSVSIQGRTVTVYVRRPNELKRALERAKAPIRGKAKSHKAKKRVCRRVV